jgi:hypothetical protein
MPDFCKPVNSWMKLGLNTMLHMFILWVFLTVFFQLILAKTIRSGFKQEIEKTIDEIVPQGLSNVNEKTNGVLCNYFKNHDFDPLIQNYSKPFAEVTKNNNYVFGISIGISIFSLIMFILLYLVLSGVCGHCNSFVELIVENLLIFLVVGVIEYMFFMKIASKYIPVAPSSMVKSFVENLKDQKF